MMLMLLPLLLLLLCLMLMVGVVLMVLRHVVVNVWSRRRMCTINGGKCCSCSCL